MFGSLTGKMRFAAILATLVLLIFVVPDVAANGLDCCP